MRCPYCGSETKSDGVFCEYCGSALKSRVPYKDVVKAADEMSVKKVPKTDKGSFYRSPSEVHVEYLGPMEFDFTHTIEDYEYTRRSVRDINRIMDSEEFREMDSETIYQYLLGQMKIVSFKDYLKRYIYERNPQMVPFSKVKEDVYVNIIIDKFHENNAPGSFNEMEIRWKATARYWLRKESATRDNVFLLGFGLKMSDYDVSDFLVKVLKEQDFRFGDPRETVFWYCFHNGLEYSKAKEYLDYYSTLPEAGMDMEGATSKELNLGQVTSLDAKDLLADETCLRNYLKDLKTHHNHIPDLVAAEYMKLYRRAARASYRIVRDDPNWDSRRKVRNQATPAEIEMILCCGIPKNDAGNLVNVSKSILVKHFQKKRMSRQRISRAIKHPNVIERFDFITLLFLVYALEVEPDWPVERFIRYIDEINTILSRCGMMSIYPVNPYESFILMCLLTEEPLATYSDIWELSFMDQK